MIDPSPTREELRLRDEYIEKWRIFKDGHFALRDDTPQEVRTFFERYQKKYSDLM